MKPTDIIKIKRIISNNNITAKELELSDSDFLAYKEAAFAMANTNVLFVANNKF